MDVPTGCSPSTLTQTQFAFEFSFSPWHLAETPWSLPQDPALAQVRPILLNIRAAPSPHYKIQKNFLQEGGLGQRSTCQLQASDCTTTQTLSFPSLTLLAIATSSCSGCPHVTSPPLCPFLQFLPTPNSCPHEAVSSRAHKAVTGNHTN